MANFTKNSARGSFLRFFLALILLWPLPLPWAAETGAALEKEIKTALARQIRCRSLEVKAGLVDAASSRCASLTLKLEGVRLDRFTADHMTLYYADPAIDFVELRKTGRFIMRSHSQSKVGILVSAASLKAFFDATAAKFHKRYNRLEIKLSPPYLESEFDIPGAEFSPSVLKVLLKYVSLDKLTGYSCVSLSARQNKLYCRSEKTIFNHFLLPKEIVAMLEKRWNPFYEIPVLSPFQYTINQAAIQNNYVYLSN